MRLGKIFIFFLMFSNIRAMQDQTIKLDTLPDDAICNIACCLNKVIGTTTWINEADLPVVLKNIKAFSLVNKKINAVLNSPEYIPVIINSLANRVNVDPKQIATQLNTPAANGWFTNSLKTSVRYKIFKTVQEIFSLANKASKEIKEGSACSFDNHYYENKNLSIIISDNSAQLQTPWGETKIIFDQSLKQYQTLQKLFKYLSVGFEQFLESPYKSAYFRIAREINNDPKDLDYFEKVPQDQIESYKGKSDILTSNDCGFGAVYTIYAVNNIPVLEELEQSTKKKLNYNVVTQEWKILKKIYNEEMGIPKKEKIAKKTPALSESLCRICEKKLYSESTRDTSCCGNELHRKCRINHFKQTSICSWCHREISKDMQAEEKILSFEHIDDIPRICSYLAKKLDTEPFFDGLFVFDKGKVLPLANSIDATLCNTMTRLSNTLLSKKTGWEIYSLGAMNSVYTKSKNGIYQICSNHKMVNIQELEKCYKKTIDFVKSGWKRAKLQDYPYIKRLKSEEEYDFFVKDQLTYDGLVLITTLARDLDVSLLCNNECEDKKEHPYLWVKKDPQNIEKFHKIFSFEIE